MPTKQERKKAVVNKLETAEKRASEIRNDMVALKEELTKIMLDVENTSEVNKLETAEKRVLEIRDEMVALKLEMAKIMLDVANTANKAICDGVINIEEAVDSTSEIEKASDQNKETFPKTISASDAKKEFGVGAKWVKDSRQPVYVLLNLPVIGRKPTDILYTLEKMINVTRALINDKDHVAIILNDSISWTSDTIWEYALDEKGKFSHKSAKHYYHTHILPYIEEADILVSPYDTYDDIVCDITKDTFYTQLRFEDFKNRNSGLKKIPFSKFEKRVIDLDTICIKPYEELKKRYDDDFKEHQEAVKCKEGDPVECMPGKECEPGEDMPDFLK